jgi:Na+/phosphate symporter
MKKTILAVIFYVIACPLIPNIHRWSPTDMAGPGWDIVVYLLSAVGAISFLIVSVVKAKSANRLSYLNLFLNVVGLSLVIFLLYLALTVRW